MKSSVTLRCRLQGILDHVVVGKLSLLDGLVDADDILPDDATSANVQVSHLGVAHQTLGEADSQRRGLKLDVARLALGELVHDRRLGGGDGVSLWGRALRGDSPAINDDYSGRASVLARRAQGRR